MISLQHDQITEKESQFQDHHPLADAAGSSRNLEDAHAYDKGDIDKYAESRLSSCVEGYCHTEGRGYNGWHPRDDSVPRYWDGGGPAEDSSAAVYGDDVVGNDDDWCDEFDVDEDTGSGFFQQGTVKQHDDCLGGTTEPSPRLSRPMSKWAIFADEAVDYGIDEDNTHVPSNVVVTTNADVLVDAGKRKRKARQDDYEGLENWNPTTKTVFDKQPSKVRHDRSRDAHSAKRVSPDARPGPPLVAKMDKAHETDNRRQNIDEPLFVTSLSAPERQDHVEPPNSEQEIDEPEKVDYSKTKTTNLKKTSKWAMFAD